MKKLLVAILIVLGLVLALVSDVYAITFVHLFVEVTGEVVDIAPAEHGKLVYIEDENERISRFFVADNVHIQGEDIAIGDTISAFFRQGGQTAYMAFAGEVQEMERAAQDIYFVRVEFTSEWRDGVIPHTITAMVDFNYHFRSERFAVGDSIAGYHSPWGMREIFDVPHYHAVFVLNGDYDVFIGMLHEGYIRNSFVTGEKTIKYEAEDLQEGDQVAVILGENPEFIILRRQNEIHMRTTLIYPRLIRPELVVTPTFEIPEIIILPMLVLPFTDPTLSAWAETYVTHALIRGVLPYNLMSDFNHPITNAEFYDLATQMHSAFLGGMVGSDDAPALWQQIEERAAALPHITLPPEEYVTRGQAATLLTRLVQITLTESQAQNGTDPIQKMQAMGIMSDVGEGNFAPQEIFTREQAIATIMRIFDLWHYEML